MLQYPVRFVAEDDGGFSVTFRDIPEAITQGDDLEDARAQAVEALITAMDFYIEDGRSVPRPSKAQRGEELVELPLSVAAKVQLLNAMVEKKVRPVELARAMHIRPQEVTRIMDMHHATKIDTLASAFHALGKRLDFQVAEA